MKVAITVQGQDLDSQVDPRFGRAAGFLVVDDQTMAFEYLDNAAGLQAVGGAGIQAARTVADAGVEAVVTGHCGPKAYQALSAAGIKIFLFNESGSARTALERFKAGALTRAQGADRPGHWG